MRDTDAPYDDGVPLTTAQAARRKAVSVRVVQRAVARGELAARVAATGRHRLMLRARDVEAWEPPCEGPPRLRHADDRLLAALRLLAEQLGRPPSQNDLQRVHGAPSVATLRRRFGGYHQALLRAGLSPTRPTGGRRRARPARELLELLADLAARLGRAPTCRDALSVPGFPPPSTFVRRFGSWRAAVSAMRSTESSRAIAPA